MTKDEAIAIAARVAAENGWPWDAPVTAIPPGWLFRRGKWEVVSNADCRGRNVRVLISDRGASILRAAFCSR
jgi:hypothetical protein